MEFAVAARSEFEAFERSEERTRPGGRSDKPVAVRRCQTADWNVSDRFLCPPIWREEKATRVRKEASDKTGGVIATRNEICDGRKEFRINWAVANGIPVPTMSHSKQDWPKQSKGSDGKR
ncbi:unnamed protein product [Bursaphelenchus xylophilus]|uniref:(pine wood nematode) hypothetical protein n=1 Tax=Bursaphelenchus xylophilus TaxID=6326 RepID=A0A1I7RHW5_BURXY|nr:unnamed protein product [Bursaphelenchus xylophilus]CAG9115323.1 unnamed protein product [Bursaphelenchus xylophilus]